MYTYICVDILLFFHISINIHVLAYLLSKLKNIINIFLTFYLYYLFRFIDNRDISILVIET